MKPRAKQYCVLLQGQATTFVIGPYDYEEAKSKEADRKALFKPFPWITIQTIPLYYDTTMMVNS